VDVSQVLDALEREWELLREFRELSSQQLALLDDESVEDMSKLLDTRSDLMLELTAIETTLGTWITQLRNESMITGEVVQELRLINDEIVQLANQLVELDEQAHRRKQKAADGFLRLNRSNEELPAYSVTLRIRPNFKFNG
jgi:chromosome segregation ATPase